MTDLKPEPDINMEIHLRTECLRLAAHGALQPERIVNLAKDFNDFITDAGRLKPVILKMPAPNKPRNKSAQIIQLVPLAVEGDEDDDDLPPGAA